MTTKQDRRAPHHSFPLPDRSPIHHNSFLILSNGLGTEIALHWNITVKITKLRASKIYRHDQRLHSARYSAITGGSQLVAAVIALSHAYHS